MKFLHYNVNPDQRPSNGKLSRDGFLNCALTAGIGSMPVVLTSLLTQDTGYILLLPKTFALSVAFTLSLFLPFHFYRGYRKRKEFISAGGDPTGINLWMFGSMGGKLLEDGSWQWKKLTPITEDYYSADTVSPKQIRRSS